MHGVIINISIITLCTHAQRGKVIILYVCRHENHHFGKSKDLGDSLASLFSQSAQKLPLVPFKSFGKAHAHHEQHLLLPNYTLFYLKHKSFYIVTLVLQQLILEDIRLEFREQQEVGTESLTAHLCVSSVPRWLYAREDQCRCQQVIAQRQRCNFFTRRSQK